MLSKQLNKVYICSFVRSFVRGFNIHWFDVFCNLSDPDHISGRLRRPGYSVSVERSYRAK